MPVAIVSQAKLQKALFDYKGAMTQSERDALLRALNGMMTRTEYDEAENNFDAHLKVRGTTNVTAEWHSFLYSELAALVGVLPGPFRLVIIHFGLEGTRLRYGFSFRTATEIRPGVYSYVESPEPTHVLVETDFRLADASTWNTLRNDYFREVKVKRTSSGVFDDLNGSDGLRVVIPWDGEIEKMYQDTTHGVSDDFRLVIDSVSVDHGVHMVNEDFRHGAAFHVERKDGGWSRMLSDNHEVTIYKNRAADFGNLCPPSCDEYTSPVR
jgi:hypothetical protein